MKIVTFAIAVTVASPHASYAAADGMTVANQLGALLAAEDACNMVYDKTAISAYIEKNVSADDLSFANMLPLMARGTTAQFNEMSDSAKVAFCTQQRRAAKKLRFVQ